MFWFAVMVGGLVLCAGISPADEPNGPAVSPGYAYPMQLNCGALNTLIGVNQTDARIAIEMNFDRVSNTLNPEMKVSLAFLTDARTAAALIHQRKLHILSITGVDYLLLSKLAAVTPLFVASKLRDSPLEPYVLLTRQGVSMADILALEKRRLVVNSKNPSDIGQIWLETVLREQGLPSSRALFTDIQANIKPIRVVLPVFFGHAEACLVPKSAYDAMIELNPQIGRKLHALLQSPGFVKNLMCAADFLAPKLIREMNVALRDMHTSEDGRQLMTVLQIRRNFPFKPEYLEDTERVFNQYLKIRPGFDMR